MVWACIRSGSSQSSVFACLLALKVVVTTIVFPQDHYRPPPFFTV